MFKAKSSLEVKIGERTYQILCDADSPLTELMDVLNLVVKNVQKVLDEASKKQEEQLEIEDFNE